MNELDEKVDISRHQITRSIDLAKLTKLKKCWGKKVAMPSYYNLILWNLEPVKIEISKVDFLAMVNELDQKVQIPRHQIARSIDLAKLTKLKNAEEKKVAMPSYYNLSL